MRETHAEVRTGRERGAAIVAVISRATHDGQFRAELRRDPVATAARAGLDLSAAEWAGLRDVLYG